MVRISSTEIKRLRMSFVHYSTFFAIGIAYFFFIQFTGYSLPCPIHALLGIDCPGCGITRLFLALFMGDFKSAFHANQAIFIAIPVFAYIFLKGEISWIKTGIKKEPSPYLVFFLCFYFLLFTLYRNLHTF